MAAASVNIHVLGQETMNYTRLCQLLVAGSTQVLRETFDRIHPPETLHYTLSRPPVRAFLESLYTGDQSILSREQWRMLYPPKSTIVSSKHFDFTLLTVLLRYISGLTPPATGWNSPPPETDTSTGADIVRVRVLRNEVYGHGSEAFVDDLMFDRYLQDIQQTLERLGGEHDGPRMDKGDGVDTGTGLYCQELLKQWIEAEGKIDQIEGNMGCLHAEAEEISPLETSVDFKSTSEHWTTRVALALRPITKHLQSLRKPKACVSSRTAARGTKEISSNKEINSHEVSAKNGTNRITPEMFHTEETRRVNETVVAQLDKAINLQQSDHIVGARKQLKGVFETVTNLPTRFFTSPTGDGLRVLQRGKKLFLEDGVCCSAKHGTLLLDTSNSGPQFYSSLLNVIGTFAEVISEFEMAKETFSLLTNFHQQSALTSRKRDLGAAYNNTGCILLMLGELKQAEYNFERSLNYLESAKHRHQLHSPLLEMMTIAVNSNIGRLCQLSRNYSKALQKQEQLVESCKAKEVRELPLQVVFTLLNNLTVLYTTLGKFSKAEQELKWMVSYCYKMDREDCDFLLNFVSLHLSEVFLSHGKPKEAEKAFRLDDDMDFAELFGGLHINVRLETVEKLVDVMVLKGKIRYAREILDRGVNRIKTMFGPNHLNVALLLYKQGKILTLAGEVSNAAEKFKCSINILEKMFGIKHPLLLKCYMSVGELALRSKQADESYFYFQRAMENIEAIYQVSFVNQLSKTYLDMTSSNTFHQSKMLEDTWKIEGLVAEHGLVLAVLLSPPNVQDDSPPLRRAKIILKQSRYTNNRDVQCPDYKEIVSFKYTSDFLQTGQIFLRQRMEKEAAAFFQQARRYSMALDATRGPAYACVARLYDVLTEKRLGNREALENKHEMSNCLEELNEVSAKISNESSSKRSNEATTTTRVATATATPTTGTFDDQLDIKLVLIFLILLSIEMKMIETTFAAYDLYSRISQKEDGFLHILNGEVQVYASKRSITCNGKTALQDVLVSSTGLHETDSQRLLPDDELYRSLAFKKNVPTDSFLVAYTSSVFLDIEELQALDRKVSLSVQECFQQKCLETGVEDSATQVVVDLTTTTSTCDHHSVLLTISRMELLSLCLLQGATYEIPQGGNISEISTAMCQKTVHLTFEDEHTSYFMFSKSAIYLLQQYSSGKISTLSVQHHCLSLMITHPVKARVTLWRKDKSISLKVQFVQTTTSHGMAGWKVPRQICSAKLVGDLAVVDSIFFPVINHLANAYQVPCTTDAEYSDEPPEVSDVHCEQSGFLLDARQPNEINVVSLRMEKSETLRNSLNASLLENLTIVSELSSQLHEDITQGNNDLAAEAHRMDISRLPTSSQSQFEQEVTSSDCNLQPSTLNPEANVQSCHSKLEAQNLFGEEEMPETRETYPLPREEEDDNLLGRSLFEKDRDSRRSLIIDLHHEVTRKSNLMNEQDGPSDEVTQQVWNRVIDTENAGKCHTATSRDQLTRTDITNSSFANATSNPKAELRAPNFMEPQSKLDDKDALERNLLEKDRKSKGASIAKLKGRKMEEISLTWKDETDTNEDFAKDQGLFEHQQVESSPENAPGQSTKEEVKRRLIDADTDDSVTQNGTENASLDNQWQSNSLSSTRGQTQHLQDVTQRQKKHTILEEEKAETISPMETGEEYIFQRRDKRESCDGQNKPLVNEQFSQAFTLANMTKRETSRSSFHFYGDTVPDGPMGTSNEIYNSSLDLVASRTRNVVDGPLKRVGNYPQIQSGLIAENADGVLTSRRQIVDETNCEEVNRGARRNEKLRASQESGKDTSFRNSHLAFLGGDVLVDGGSTDSLPEVNTPALTGEAFMTCQDGTKRISENETRPFSSNAARDEVGGRVYSPKSDSNVNDPPGFGGARPKEIIRNSTRSSSLNKTKNCESISTYQDKETGDVGLKPGFLARHTVKSNGAILDLPPQGGWGDPYFSARACESITNGKNLRLLGKGINPPGYTSSPSSQGLYEQAAFAARPSTRGNAQSLAIHQKRSLDQKQGWHLESPNGDQGLCASQQNASQSENSSISNVKAPFGSRGSQSVYDEMDSMSNEYHNSIGNVDNRMVKSLAVVDGHHSSSEDSTSSLLGSLQQIMSKTVNLIASSNAVAKQPQNEPKETFKLSIQEEARGRREQEQAVRTRVEDSRNQGESTQDNEETERQHIPTPVQETPRPVCSHYQRRCLVSFPCCGKFYPCHRCHNESKDCSNDHARATNATHIRCSICYHEQEIDEQSQNCGGCKSKMSEYFCATCKHFTSVDKNPFHCDKCGICRIHRDRSFHCDVCNVCLDKRLQGKHKCRADSGHDECCICLEDAFSGCQILPCSHKVHRDCAIAMIQNGVRSCPVCRHPLFSQPQNSPQ